MTEFLFYHLERSKLEQVLPVLLEKSLEHGSRVMVCTNHSDGVGALDDHLWTYRDDSFLPHVVLGSSDFEESEPVLLSRVNGDAVKAPPNGADFLFLVQGAQYPYEDLKKFTRTIVMFDGRDDEALGEARGFWKVLRDASKEENNDFSQTYWRQNDQGRWEQQA